MSIVNSHTGFQPLEEVWLGDTYPEEYYDVLEPELRDFVLQVSELTKQDLSNIQQKLESLGVKVCRPEFKSVNDYLDYHGNLSKPPITPRDWALTLGDQLLVLPQYESLVEPFQTHIDRYGKQARVLKRFQAEPEDWCWITFPSVVRVGLDIFIDYNVEQKAPTMRIAEQLVNKGYRVHLSTTTDHTDGVFALLKPEQILASHYRSHYNVGFPGWDVIHLKDTSRGSNNLHTRWWVDGVNLQHFNNSMINTIGSWLGDPNETVFEVNVLVVDESNVLVIAQDDDVCKQLEQRGITPHVVDFKTRGFWDGGLHCLTLDIRRTGNCEDYWPNRGAPGIDYDTEYV